MAHPQNQPFYPPQTDPKSPFLDTLYCEEDHRCINESISNCFHTNPNSDDGGGGGGDGMRLIEQELNWDGDDLSNLLSREEGNLILENILEGNSSLGFARHEAVEWMMRVHDHFRFRPLTAILAVDYLDRFMGCVQFQDEKPWMMQLAAVACMSLAAKVEEMRVPLLMDLQVEEAKYVFQAKTITRMEILVLSTLGWKMNPVTPHSFVDYVARRLGLEDTLCWEFIRKCDRVLVSLVHDPRVMRYLPSVIAAAAILHIFNSLEICIGYDYQDQVLGILGSDKDKVEECRQLILESSSKGKNLLSSKRKPLSMPGSPNGVVDVSFSSDCSNESWAIASSVSSSPEPFSKRIKTGDRISTRFSHSYMDYLSIPR
ncbi:hypothetical protein Drorol1_Dr00010170 [Drosera rotundifolia]